MFQFKPENYGSAVAELLSSKSLCPVGPGKPDESLRPMLDSLEIQAGPNEQIVDKDMADCCRAGLWLMFNFLDDSHAISQGIGSSSGSYWHGIMHRREPDFSNAKYWFRRVGDHEIFATLVEEARKLARQAEVGSESAFLRNQNSWDPYRFVDLCESVMTDCSSPAQSTGTQISGTPQLCREVAQLEWRLLFDSCYQRAVG